MSTLANSPGPDRSTEHVTTSSNSSNAQCPPGLFSSNDITELPNLLSGFSNDLHDHSLPSLMPDDLSTGVFSASLDPIPTSSLSLFSATEGDELNSMFHPPNMFSPAIGTDIWPFSVSESTGIFAGPGGTNLNDTYLDSLRFVSRVCSHTSS